MNQEHKRPVTVEDLLRLKRAERPPAEFWNQFDRQLRAKQLAAIVEKRPWWRTFPRAFGNLSRYHLPLGATAILALTVLTVREYRSVAASPASGDSRVIGMAAPVTAALSSEVLIARSTLPVRTESAAGATENDAPADPASFVLASEATASGDLARMIPVLGASRDAGAESESTPTARFIAANLALAKATEPAVAQNLLGASHGFEARALPAKTPVVDPLSQMASPSDVRRSRLRAGMSVSMNTPAPARAPEVRSRRLSDEQLYDTISRFEPRGNGLAVKF